jgi:hypothetical protein
MASWTTETIEERESFWREIVCATVLTFIRGNSLIACDCPRALKPAAGPVAS